MKWFTEPKGKFVIQIPTEWKYANPASDIEEKSPFCFQLYQDSTWSFQVSCYSNTEYQANKKAKVQNADTNKLEFDEMDMSDPKHWMHVWYANVGDHFFAVKFIFDKSLENDRKTLEEIEQVKEALATLEFISEGNRKYALIADRYEKFMAAPGASSDLKISALEKDSFIEYTIIAANQIDAYLRISLILEGQLNSNSDEFDDVLLYQGDTDRPVSERKIYDIALGKNIIEKDLFDELEALYKQRNKLVHRYIISDLKSRDLIRIAYDYEKACEKIRLLLRALELEQFNCKIGIHGHGRHPHDAPTSDDLKLLYSQVNDKHLIDNLERLIEDADLKNK